MWRFQRYAILFSFLGQIFIECAVTNKTSSFADPTDLNGELSMPVNESLSSPIGYGDAGTSIEFESYPGEECNRACSPDDQRICYFKFVLEHYQAMGVACDDCIRGNENDCDNLQCIVGDGFEKGVMSINRQIPGPAIHVCQNDRIIVDVVNMAGGTAAALHWHGLHMRATPWMDGVPFVTQCPIPFATTFRYQFIATQPGTQFYHSHAGHHKVNGQYGALIIRQPKLEDKHLENFDYDLPEHTIVVSDWMHGYAESLFPGLPSLAGILPDSVLINGRGSFVNRENGERKSPPPSRFYVTPGKRFRFRFINTVSHACPVQVQIENHEMLIIASDSYDVESRSFDTLVTNSGERYDFVVEANKPFDDYWIRVSGLGICDHLDSVAILRYRTNLDNIVDDTLEQLPEMPNIHERYPPGIILNHPHANCVFGIDDHCITELNALEIDDDLRFAAPDYKLYLSFNNFPVDKSEIIRKGHYPHFINLGGNSTLVGAINHISLVFPDFPPLTQPEDIDDSMFCDEFNKPQHCQEGKLCSCVHRLRVSLGSIVELVVVDESDRVGPMHHPFHLHGYPFLVTDLGQHPHGEPLTVQLVRQMEIQRSLPRGIFNTHPPWKDTVSIPSFGFATIRFRANNPGYWLMHCHYEWHLAIGMGLIVQVGENSEMVPPPKGFPKCGNYLPELLPGL